MENDEQISIVLKSFIITNVNKTDKPSKYKFAKTSPMKRKVVIFEMEDKSQNTLLHDIIGETE